MSSCLTSLATARRANRVPLGQAVVPQHPTAPDPCGVGKPGTLGGYVRVTRICKIEVRRE